MPSMINFVFVALASSAIAHASVRRSESAQPQDFTYEPTVLPTVTVTVVEIPDWCLTPTHSPTTYIESSTSETETETPTPYNPSTEPTPEPTPEPEPTEPEPTEEPTEPTEEPTEPTEEPTSSPTEYTSQTSHSSEMTSSHTGSSSTPTSYPTPSYSSPPTTNNGQHNVAPFSLLITSIVLAVAAFFK